MFLVSWEPAVASVSWRESTPARQNTKVKVGKELIAAGACSVAPTKEHEASASQAPSTIINI